MISVVIITFNEENNISQCIESVGSIASEVIVVDANSTDQTVQLARELGAQVTLKSWEGYGAARNYGASIAQYDWIFSLDADERVGTVLGRNLTQKRLVKTNIYQISRRNLYCSRRIRFGMLHPQWKTRLYHRKLSEWNASKVHEELDSHSECSIARIEGELLHYAYNSEDEFRQKLSKYAQLSAEGWQDQNYNPGLFLSLTAPFYHFIRSYILQLGILEGTIGWETSKGAYYYSKEKHQQFKRLVSKEIM